MRIRRHTDSHLGLSHADRWELLWTKSTYAIRAARSLRPGQVVSAIAGLNVLTMKKKLQQTLKVCANAGERGGQAGQKAQWVGLVV